MALWPDKAPLGDGTFEDCSLELEVFLPPADKANGVAIVLCPGGGYIRHVTDREGYPIAQWLNEHGIATVILEYRLPKLRHQGPALSDRDVRFGNECARLLRKRFPNEDCYVSINAYGNPRPAPLKTKPEDNVVVMNVANNFWKVDTPDKDCLVGKTYAKHYADWSRPTKHVSLGDLARFIVERNIATDHPIRLNKEIEAALGDIEDASGQPLLKIEEGQTSPSLTFKRKD